MFLWMIKKKTTTGIEVMIAPAMRGPQAVPRVVWFCSSQAIKFWLSGLLSVLMMMARRP